MHIRKVSLNNFRCFKSAEIEFGKITFLLGANSGGKSSIIQSFLLPFQSNNFPLKLNSNGKYCKLGDYEDVVNMHNKKNNVSLNYEILLEDRIYQINTSWKYDKQSKLPIVDQIEISSEHLSYLIKKHENNFRLTFKYNIEKDTKSRIDSIQNFTTKIVEMLKSENSEDTNAYDGVIDRIGGKFSKNKQKVISFTVSDIDNLENAAHSKGSYVLDHYLSRVLDYFKNDQNLNYIDSFRYNPQRIKYDATNSDLKVGKSGENYEDQILMWQTQKSQKYVDLVNEMKKLKLLQGIVNNRAIGGTFNTKLKTHRKGAYSSITDVGFGISQFLPIIVADLQLNKQSTLLISQPEIHLHPSVQSDFGDYLCDKIKSQNKRYVIETHSEYLINKIRLLIANGTLDEQDVRVYFFDNNGDSVKVDEIKYKKNGSIENAPNEYFKTYMTDVMQIAINAIK